MFNKNTIYIAAVATVMAFVWFLLWPMFQAAEESRAELHKQRENLAVAREVEADIRDSLSFLDQLTDREHELLDLVAPPSVDKTNLAFLLDNMATDNGLILNSVEIKESTVSTTAALSEVEVSLNLEGNYGPFKAFIRSLENTLRIFDIQNIEINPSEENLNRYIIKGKVYYTP